MRKMLGGKTTQSRMGLVSSFTKKKRGRRRRKWCLCHAHKPTQMHSGYTILASMRSHDIARILETGPSRKEPAPPMNRILKIYCESF